MSFNGSYVTAHDAIKAGIDSGTEQFFVGERQRPKAPEEFFFCDDWLSLVEQQDDYQGPQAKLPLPEREARQELDLVIRKVMRAWLHKHKLQPKFTVIKNIQLYEIEPKTKQVILSAKEF